MASDVKFSISKAGSSVSYDASVIIDYLEKLEGIDSKKNLNKLARKGSGPFVFKDIMDHFEKQAGPQSPWPEWSQPYSNRMVRLGKGNNNILQDSGALRQGIEPGNYRLGNGLIVWFNKVEYAKRHDEGDPTRSFMWLSDKALGKVGAAVLDLAFSLGK